tara:strand:- start:1550 stop:2023 length:474 start_codon:yes stop_codon:yes gene_type:complete
MTCCGSVTVTNSNCSVVLQLTSTRVVDVIAEGPVGPTGAAGAAGAPGAAGPPKSLTIASPVTGDEFTLFNTQVTTTITSVIGVVRGTSSPSVTLEFRYGPDRAAAGTLATVSTAITNTTTGQLLTVQNMPIPVDQFFWVKITAVSGTVAEVNVSVKV